MVGVLPDRVKRYIAHCPEHWYFSWIMNIWFQYLQMRINTLKANGSLSKEGIDINSSRPKLIAGIEGEGARAYLRN